jgi:hypothetical protein
MSRDVLITPANGIVEFKHSSNTKASIQLDTANNLIISTFDGDVTFGTVGTNIYVGDGVNSVDLVFEQSGKIRGLLGKTITLGQNDSFVNTASPFGFVSPDGSKTITARMLNTDVLSFQGGVGELLSISDSMTGSIFTVNDVSGIPSIEVMDTGLIKLAPFGGAVSFANSTGTAGQVLTSNGSSSPPTWQDPSGGGVSGVKLYYFGSF